MDKRPQRPPGAVFKSVIALFCWLIRMDMQEFDPDPHRMMQLRDNIFMRQKYCAESMRLEEKGDKHE